MRFQGKIIVTVQKQHWHFVSLWSDWPLFWSAEEIWIMFLLWTVSRNNRIVLLKQSRFDFDCTQSAAHMHTVWGWKWFSATTFSRTPSQESQPLLNGKEHHTAAMSDTQITKATEPTAILLGYCNAMKAPHNTKSETFSRDNDTYSYRMTADMKVKPIVGYYWSYVIMTQRAPVIGGGGGSIILQTIQVPLDTAANQQSGYFAWLDLELICYFFYFFFQIS